MLQEYQNANIVVFMLFDCFYFVFYNYCFDRYHSFGYLINHYLTK
ncbi:hypothetical protein yruck0001_5740 [Yersinia ruckeri ATCC 29473]|uniref:Uncharacterized protein n=1 Tax=Yersinia ruckeri TaxID=29486 RepID=A0A0A8VFZ9_YERRU|nr:hypothetical protein yruck0001_5740 [Yersinia ruckeri ATCC 29473]CEK28515.1 hypothetical protein CSF007_13915 [Yersinia ruckeri]